MFLVVQMFCFSLFTPHARTVTTHVPEEQGATSQRAVYIQSFKREAFFFSKNIFIGEIF